MSDENELRHEPKSNRFTLRSGVHTAVLTYRRISATTLDYRHTFVPPEARGRSLASRLTVFALEYARSQGLKVLPSCPFVAVYVERHPNWNEIVAVVTH